jgi:hypothetical protein
LFVSDIVSQPATAPNAEWPSPGGGSGWPPDSGPQAIDDEMDPQVTGDARYSDLIDDALLAIPSVSIVTDIDNLFDSFKRLDPRTGQNDSWQFMNPQYATWHLSVMSHRGEY